MGIVYKKKLDNRLIVDVFRTKSGLKPVVALEEDVFYHLQYYGITSCTMDNVVWEFDLPGENVRMNDRKINLITNGEYIIVFSCLADLAKFTYYERNKYDFE